VRWATFAGDVGGLTARLGHVSHGRWAVFTEESYAFAVAVTAVWQAGGTAVVLPNAQPGALTDIAPGTNGLITDTRVVAAGAPTIPALSPEAIHDRALQPVPRALDAVELFTSGTTGDRKAVQKTIAHLEDEIAGLEAAWGPELDGRQALGTVSHQHIYGLLFRVLWPLTAGRAFRSEALLFPEEMLARLDDGARAYLVSTPAHLRRLTMMEKASALGRVCQPFFSSGGAISGITARDLIDTVGAAPFEVFGSTETGGVAWRRQTEDPGSTVWTAFPDVRVGAASSGSLHVASPRVSAPGEFTMADRVEMLDDRRFQVLGRADRTVKIADKRLSLPDMEDRLLGHPWVAETALTVVGSAADARIGAVVVLTGEGRSRLASAGRRAIADDLTTHLARYWDRVLLPRRYRYVHRLPEDAQGKVTAAAVASLFGTVDEPAAWPVDILTEHTDGAACTRRLRVPAGDVFAGHFPDLPVVPGFVQIDWVMDAAVDLVGRPVTLRRIEGLKFRDLVRPEQVVDLRAELSEDRTCLTFKLSRQDGRVVSQGRCWLADDAR
jgi:acyl-CoA synthetase (AMP-forming)/AMP-acid ligase II/3-hydroxymyristoyl/3-hydroxydecanoyl-(acyl carrier protein) dehydratase